MCLFYLIILIFIKVSTLFTHCSSANQGGELSPLAETITNNTFCWQIQQCDYFEHTI